jgi:hypothetical protein
MLIPIKPSTKLRINEDGSVQLETRQPVYAPQDLAIMAVQAHLDTFAQSWGYDDIFTACTYAEEPTVPRFQAEGRALRAWRSQVWEAATAAANVVSSIEQLISMLPNPPTRP